MTVYYLQSTALRISSIKTILALEYTARASATRAFCPPERVIPFSPISVKSPSSKINKSLSKAHAVNVAR